MGRDMEENEWIIFKQLMHLIKSSDNVHTISYLNKRKLIRELQYRCLVLYYIPQWIQRQKKALNNYCTIYESKWAKFPRDLNVCFSVISVFLSLSASSAKRSNIFLLFPFSDTDCKSVLHIQDYT